MIFRLLTFFIIIITILKSTPVALAFSYQQTTPINSQTETTTVIQGKITEAGTGEPVPFANVFLNNTMTGTTTDEQGVYKLAGVPFGNVELIVSYIGYLPFKRAIRVENNQTITVNISLTPSEQVLTEVEVKAKQDKAWQRQYKKFEKSLLGQTSNSSLCKILNPWVLDFKEDENTLVATAGQPLEIENKALGYKLFYFLKKFELNKLGAAYLGETKFEALKPEDAKEESRWLKNRQEAYNGSIRHFFKSLIDNNSENEGFLAYKIDREKVEEVNTMHQFFHQQLGKTHSKLAPEKVLFPGLMNFERRMVFAGKIEIHYTKATDRNSPYKDIPYQVSRIKVRKSYIELNSQGLAYDPSSFELSGYLVKEGVADILPHDYMPEGSKNRLTQTQGVVAANSFLDTLEARFARTQSLRSEQKVYLHLDKPYYASGEILWYSVYLLEASQNSLYSGSQVLYVDLISPEGQLIRQHKLKTLEGRAAGDITLPKTLATGTYRLRAYSNWMRNIDPSYFYDRPIEIYNIGQGTPSTSTQPSAAELKNKDVASLQFFPEGGNLVRGIASRVGFKAVDSNGKGLSVKGNVLDEEGNKIVSFESNALGMGSFLFKPLPGKKYKATSETKAGSREAVLPDILSQGVTMAVSYPDSNLIGVKIMATENHRQEDVYLVGQSGGIIYHTAEEKLNNGIAFIEIPSAKFPAGICQLTLFSSKGLPLCERLFFVQDTESELTVNVQADKKNYQPREKAELAISLNDVMGNPASATFSMSVLDADQISQDSLETHISAYLLLTSDLKGYVEKPAYYFNGNKIGRPEDLDNLMITQGWRRFKWQPILAGQASSSSFNKETGLVISGKAFIESKKKPTPVALTKLTFIPIDSLKSLPQEVTTAQDGRFQLKTFDFLDTANLMYHATDKKGKKFNVTIVLDTLPHPDITKPAFPLPELQPAGSTLSYLKNALLRSKTDSIYARYDTKQLAEVVVEGKKVNQTPSEFQGVTKVHSEADAVLIIDEKFPPTSNIYEMMSGRLAGVQVVRDAEKQNSYNVNIRNSFSYNSSTQPLYLLDGMPIEDPDGNALMNFNPLDVARIEILKGANASMYGVRGGNGVIAIYTKKGVNNLPQSDLAGMKSLKIAGYQYPREFYSPAYDVQKEENTKPDYRATLYWAPILYTDEKGKANVSFFNSDKATRMQIIIEGISASGTPVIYSTFLGK